MKLGILHTGNSRQTFHSEHGDYAYMFEKLLREGGGKPTFIHYRDIRSLCLPNSPNECDAWLITGSSSGVYEQKSWISQLEQFVIACRKHSVPMVGICFGHQLIAQALGGTVTKSELGWGCGVHTYDIVQTVGWMNEPKDQVSIQVHHQDQVIVVPSDAIVLASSDFCPNAMLAYDNWGFSFQGHPEFTTDYAADLIRIRIRLQNGLPYEQAVEALATISNPPIDRLTQARWICEFLNQNM